jgi:succinate dehydrogenase hydrophobic anchor subunit
MFNSDAELDISCLGAALLLPVAQHSGIHFQTDLNVIASKTRRVLSSVLLSAFRVHLEVGIWNERSTFNATLQTRHNSHPSYHYEIPDS